MYNVKIPNFLKENVIAQKNIFFKIIQVTEERAKINSDYHFESEYLSRVKHDFSMFQRFQCFFQNPSQFNRIFVEI